MASATPSLLFGLQALDIARGTVISIALNRPALDLSTPDARVPLLCEQCLSCTKRVSSPRTAGTALPDVPGRSLTVAVLVRWPRAVAPRVPFSHPKPTTPRQIPPADYTTRGPCSPLPVPRLPSNAVCSRDPMIDSKNSGRGPGPDPGRPLCDHGPRSGQGPDNEGAQLGGAQT